MLENIKGLMQIKQEIDSIKGQMDEQSRASSKLTGEIALMKEGLSKTHAAQEQILSELRASLGAFSEIKEDLSKEVFDFKLLKGALQKKILEKFEEELKAELKINVETLRDDLSSYEEVKNSIKDSLKKMELTKQEMGKWLEISSNIKASDFELHKFARQLTEADREKLALMQKIDTLERMVSKMRRSNEPSVLMKRAQY